MSMTPRQYTFATPADLDGGENEYRTFCQAFGLEPISGGWGFVHCIDDDGQHWTLITSDVEYQRMLVEADKTPGILEGLEVSAEKYTKRRRGWPIEWTPGRL